MRQVQTSSEEGSSVDIVGRNPGKPGHLTQHGPAVVLVILLGAFILLQSLLPLRTAVIIGADEGFEVSRALLCAAGYRLYFDIWNDQPPLYTFLLTQFIERLSASILTLRVLTSVFTLVLLTSFFLICLRVSGLLVAGTATAFLIMSPGFLELSSSCLLSLGSLLFIVHFGSRFLSTTILGGHNYSYDGASRLLNVTNRAGRVTSEYATIDRCLWMPVESGAWPGPCESSELAAGIMCV